MNLISIDLKKKDCSKDEWNFKIRVEVYLIFVGPHVRIIVLVFDFRK
jgi:hypothetical protein